MPRLRAHDNQGGAREMQGGGSRVKLILPIPALSG